MGFKKLPWGLLVAYSYQNFRGTTMARCGLFKDKTGEFGPGLVGDVVSRKFVTPGRSYKDPSRVLIKTRHYLLNDIVSLMKIGLQFWYVQKWYV